MAAAMNGMALHGGIIPYRGTFLVFSDYCRPSIRLAALMGQRVIYVMTHDSIGLGEDGPTHQPVEHLAALRAIPNLLRVPPGRRGRDGRVLGACARAQGPAERARADPPEPAAARAPMSPTRTSAPRGAYVIAAAERQARRRHDLRHRLGGRDRGRRARSCSARRRASRARVVSMPCWELFDWQRRSLSRRACSARRRVKSRVEAASRFGWDAIIGDRRRLRRHDAASAPSAPYKDLYKHFGITPEAVAAAAEGCARLTARSLRETDVWLYASPSTASAASAATCCAPSSRPAARTSRSSAINDLGPVETNAHLLRYDSVHGRFPGEVHGQGRHASIVGHGPIKVTAERDPAKLPWKELGVDIALECTGIFTAKDKAAAHLDAGAKRVLISAPGRRRRPHRRLRRQPRQADQGAHGRLQRLLHHQLPGAGRQGAATTRSASSTAS